MSNMLPVALYGLQVPADNEMIPAVVGFPATFRITMAAIDPSTAPKHTDLANGDGPPRATLKIIYAPVTTEEDSDSDEDTQDTMRLQGLLGNDSEDDEDDDESSSDDEEKHGGPSDPTKSKKARKEAAAAEMLKALKQEDSGENMDDTSSSPVANGLPSKKNKGKAKAILPEESESEDDMDEDNEAGELQELVLCTLGPNHHYQQPLDITIPEDQMAFFKVSGTHAIYLSGNYVVDQDGRQVDDENESDYDMSPDEDELEGDLDDEESDELDNIDDPRITELESEGEEAPKLVNDEKKAKAAEKGKNKRDADALDEDAATLDAIMSKSLKPAEPSTVTEPKLSKKQLKKLKNNAGKAVEAAIENKDVKKEDPSPAKGDKKVQFAKNLEQGPTNAAKDVKVEAKPLPAEDTKAGRKESTSEKPKATLGPKTLGDGVKIDDKKLGAGPACKKGDKVGMRYIGKLESGKVFDANKKGPPFTFTVGVGEVIKGWDSGIPGMSVGGERRVVVPAKLGYGVKGTSGIPPNSQLTFDVKLLSIS